MAVVSTWVNNSIAGTTGVGTGLPSITVDIPANKTLKRVVLYGAAGGIQSGNGAVTAFGPVQLQNNITLGFPTTNQKTIYQTRDLVTFRPVALDDHNLLTSNRVYTIYHGIGTREMGANLQMSWGGPISPAMRLTCGMVFVHLLAGMTAFNMTYSFVMKALYQTG